MYNLWKNVIQLKQRRLRSTVMHPLFVLFIFQLIVRGTILYSYFDGQNGRY